MATRFPSGLISRGVPLLGPGGNNLVPFTTGSYFFVDSSTGSAGNSGTESTKPMATINQAIAKCTAGKGDVILVLPGHAETVTSGSVSLSKAGISVIGLGQGANRPTLTFSSDVTVTVTAADCLIRNMIFNANFADVAVGITVSAKDCQIESCSFVEAGTDLNWFTCIATSATNNACDGLKIFNCYEHSVDAATKAFISILGNITRLHVEGNVVNQGSTIDAGHFIITSSKVLLGVRLLNNILTVVGATGATVGIFLTGSGTTSTGVMAYNLVSSLDTTTELIVTAGTGIAQFENYYTGTADASGKLWPVVDAA